MRALALVAALASPAAVDAAPALAFTASSAHPLAAPSLFRGAQPPVRVAFDDLDEDDVVVKVQLVPPGVDCARTHFLSAYDQNDPYVLRVVADGENVAMTHRFGRVDDFGAWSLCASSYASGAAFADLSATWEPVPLHVTRLCSTAEREVRRAEGRLSLARRRQVVGDARPGEVTRRRAALRRAQQRMRDAC